MLHNYNIIEGVVFTERSTQNSENNNVYTFKVNPSANKLQIKDAVELAFNVKVANVRTVTVHPKIKNDMRRGVTGKTKKMKKAMVQLQSGHTIEFA